MIIPSHTLMQKMMNKLFQTLREIHQGVNRNIEFDDENLNPRKRKDPRASDVEALSSSATGGSSTPPSKKRRMTVELEDLTIDWKMTVEEIREIMLEHNASFQTRKVEHQSIKFSQHLASCDAKKDQYSTFQY
ncbi:unnamed protein product [Lactuca saligna]|uniref:Uncharacterized protein n=1 Tax=Lactuca saligna TaxID=75948 RepID=A0AA35YVM8_LACSI|nr:unnamed protein product [Lactuca saligna]